MLPSLSFLLSGTFGTHIPCPPPSPAAASPLQLLCFLQVAILLSEVKNKWLCRLPLCGLPIGAAALNRLQWGEVFFFPWGEQHCRGLCWKEAVLLGRIIEEEAAQEKKTKKNKAMWGWDRLATKRSSLSLPLASPSSDFSCFIATSWFVLPFSFSHCDTVFTLTSYVCVKIQILLVMHSCQCSGDLSPPFEL